VDGQAPVSELQPPPRTKSPLTAAILLTAAVAAVWFGNRIWHESKASQTGHPTMAARRDRVPVAEAERAPSVTPSLTLAGESGAGARWVRVSSHPAGAQVWQGPRLLGGAPVWVAVAGAAPVRLWLAHPGYDELAYDLRDRDGDSVTLRLEAQTGAST